MRLAALILTVTHFLKEYLDRARWRVTKEGAKRAWAWFWTLRIRMTFLSSAASGHPPRAVLSAPARPGIQASPAPVTVLLMLSRPCTTPQYARRAQGSGPSQAGRAQDRVVLKTHGDNRQQRFLNWRGSCTRCNSINWSSTGNSVERPGTGSPWHIHHLNSHPPFYIMPQCALQLITP